MTSFDERFADRVREVFDAYEEPVDERALARLQATLGGAGAPAPDRAPRRPRVATGWRRAGLPMLAVLVLIGGVWAALTQRAAPSPDRLGAEAARPSPSTALIAEAAPAAPPAAPTSPAPEAAPSVFTPPAPLPPPPRPGVTPIAEAGPEAPLPAPSPAADVPPRSREPLALVPAVPPMPGLPDRPYDARPDVTAPPPVPFTARGGPEPEGVRLVVASGTVASGGDFGDGAGVAAGLSRAWTVAPGLSVSGGALLAYGRYVTDPQGPATATVFAALEDDPDETVDVPSQSVLTTVAVEVPVDVTVDVVRTARGRLRASVGLTSALYVGQTFEDEGRRYSAEYVAVPQTSETVFVVSSEPYAERETAPAGRLDLGRQLNLGLGVVGAGADGPGLDLYARLPLGGLTSRDLTLTTVGVRLRVPLP